MLKSAYPFGPARYVLARFALARLVHGKLQELVLERLTTCAETGLILHPPASVWKLSRPGCSLTKGVLCVRRADEEFSHILLPLGGASRPRESAFCSCNWT